MLRESQKEVGASAAVTFGRCCSEKQTSCHIPHVQLEKAQKREGRIKKGKKKKKKKKKGKKERRKNDRGKVWLFVCKQGFFVLFFLT